MKNAVLLWLQAVLEPQSRAGVFEPQDFRGSALQGWALGWAALLGLSLITQGFLWSSALGSAGFAWALCFPQSWRCFLEEQLILSANPSGLQEAQPGLGCCIPHLHSQG